MGGEGGFAPPSWCHGAKMAANERRVYPSFWCHIVKTVVNERRDCPSLMSKQRECEGGKPILLVSKVVAISVVSK